MITEELDRLYVEQKELSERISSVQETLVRVIKQGVNLSENKYEAFVMAYLGIFEPEARQKKVEELHRLDADIIAARGDYVLVVEEKFPGDKDMVQYMHSSPESAQHVFAPSLASPEVTSLQIGQLSGNLIVDLSTGKSYFPALQSIIISDMTEWKPTLSYEKIEVPLSSSLNEAASFVFNVRHVAKRYTRIGKAEIESFLSENPRYVSYVFDALQVLSVDPRTYSPILEGEFQSRLARLETASQMFFDGLPGILGAGDKALQELRTYRGALEKLLASAEKDHLEGPVVEKIREAIGSLRSD